jgi:hypothetical protein
MKKNLKRKKSKPKKREEESYEDSEELKELAALAGEIKQYREDNPGILSLTEQQIMQVLAVKIKYNFQKKTKIEILNEIKEGIKNDVFRETEDEAETK